MRLLSFWSRSAAAFLCCLIGSGAARADWTYLDTDPARADFSGGIPIADAHGVTLFGFSNLRATLARYGNDGSSQQIRVVGDGRAFGGDLVYDAQPLADGGYAALALVRGGLGQDACFAERIAPDLSLRWQRLATPLALPCAILGTDGQGTGFWVRGGNHVEHYAPDGMRTVEFAAYTDGDAKPMAGVVRDDGALFLATNAGPNGVPVLSVHTPEGDTGTLWTGTDATLTFARLGMDSGYNVYALGVDSVNVHAASFTQTGTLRWERGIAAGAQPHLIATAAGADGRVYGVDQRQFLFAFLNTGENLFGHAFGPGCPSGNDCVAHLAIGAGGDAIAAFDGAPTQLMLANFQANSVTAVGFPNSHLGYGGLAALADGSVVFGALRYAAAAEPQVPGFAHVARDGTYLGDLALTARVDADVRAQNVAQADDGSTYVVSSVSYDYTVDATLSAVSPQGQLRWKRALPGQYVYRSLQAGSDRLCYSHTETTTTVVECRAASDGALLWSTQLPSVVYAMALLSDDAIVALGEGFLSNSLHYLLDAQGNVLHAVDVGHDLRPSSASAFAANGTIVVSDVRSTHKVYAFNRDGTLVYAAMPPLDGDGNLDGTVAVNADGGAVLLAQLGSITPLRTYAWSLSPQGQTRWVQQQDRGLNELSLPKISTSAVYLARLPTDNHALAIVKLGLDDGAVLADDEFADVPGLRADAVLRTDHATGLLLATQRGAALVRRVAVIDPDQHRVLRQLVLDCGGPPCDPYSSIDAALSGDGTLRVVGGSIDADQGVRFRIDAVANATATSNVRIDQAGLDGAWFAPYESGQGFVFDYIASGKTVFMPWFTYAGGAALNDPSGLAWYTLQGTVTSGANHVDLTIGNTDPGVFNSGAVGAHAVGNAVLTFSDCQSGLLLYQFSLPGTGANGGAIALSRLTPSTSPCVLANGSTTPAQIANEPTQGFDARQSGSWFDPATAGQGLEFTIVPPGKGGSGLVFATWFTFDPSGAADDVAQRHWFTLQGDLRNVDAGIVHLPILRTIGGSFDASPTGNTVQVGQATLTMLGCDKAKLDYAFDQSDVAHRFAGLAGSENLVKIGGCTAP